MPIRVISPSVRSLGLFCLLGAWLTGQSAHASITRNNVLSSAAPVATSGLSWWQTLLAAPLSLFGGQNWLSPMQPAALLPTGQAPALSTCTVEPLPTIEDEQALAFEAGLGALVAVDVKHLTPATMRALGRFEQVVERVGGSMTVTSAYRPVAYQEHLRAVWEKWMLELRDNSDLACQELRAEAEAEFTGHQLLETQRPVTASDHTRGLAFDANVTVPRTRGRLNVDRLALLAGLHRPAPAADRVHFRLMP